MTLIVEGKQSGVVIIREVGAHLRCQNVIVIVEHGQMFHRTQVNLDDNSPIRAGEVEVASQDVQKNGENRKPR